MKDKDIETIQLIQERVDELTAQVEAFDQKIAKQMAENQATLHDLKIERNRLQKKLLRAKNCLTLEDQKRLLEPELMKQQYPFFRELHTQDEVD